MNLKSRIESLERQAGIRAVQQEEERAANATDEELWFFFCHGCHPEQLDGRVEREVERQYTENGLRVTIILEPVE